MNIISRCFDSFQIPIKLKMTSKRYIYERRVLKYAMNCLVIGMSLMNLEHCMEVNHGFILVLLDMKQRFV